MSRYKYADIIVPVAVDAEYTYDISDLDSARINVGSRLIVSFGKSRVLIGVVSKLHSNKPDYPKIKKTLGVPETVSSISEFQIKFWQWMSNYYICTMGEVMDAALPVGLKIKSGSTTSNYDLKYSKKKISVVCFAKAFTELEMNDILDSLKRAKSAKKILEKYLDLVGFGEELNTRNITITELLNITNTSPTSLSLLATRGILKLKKISLDPSSTDIGFSSKSLSLSPAQLEAYGKIISGFEERNTVLLKGVTSSGKTEIYIHLIKMQLQKGKQVLYLLPEIALTAQLINRLRTYFGDTIGIYHSRFNDTERVEVWLKCSKQTCETPYKVILGVRSSLFLPFDELGLIIVDEEHDSSYKQYDPAPRYNARDSSIMLATLHKAKVLLGSATPSIESVYNCKVGKFKLVELNTRYGKAQLPKIEIADSRDAIRRKAMVSHFTPQMVLATELALKKGEQIVFFRNRRGYSSFLMCHQCGWVPYCPDCSVSITYHKGISKLKCHYCGYSSDLPSICSSCGSTNINMKGFGTEKIEDELSMIFPDCRIARMDHDTTRKKGSLDRIIKKIENGEVDIVVGTQMISKGLDFENLTVVGVLNVDNMLFFPDFRAEEKCFQLIEQVSGRAGRRQKQGKVILQSSNPSNRVIRQAINHDFWLMYQNQLDDRKEFSYPPFSRLIKLFAKHRDANTNKKAANKLASTLRASLNLVILGPEFNIISRIQNNYIMTILIKIPRENKDISRIKQFIKNSIKHTISESKISGLRIYADVDPNG